MWTREFEAGVVLLNPAVTGSPAQSVALPQGFVYRDLYNETVASPVSVGATNGLVLLSQPVSDLSSS